MGEPCRFPTGRSSRRAGILAVLLLVVAFGAPVLWLHRNSNRNLISFHGTLHTAVAQRFIEPHFPPENPFLAGEPLRYYWFYHWLGHQVSRAANVPHLLAFEALSMLGLAMLAATAVILGYQLYGSCAVGAFLGVLVLAGSNGLGWLIAISRVIRHGTDVLHGSAAAIIGPALSLVQYGNVRYGPNFIYFVSVTSRPLAFALTLLMLASLNGAVRGKSTVSWWLLLSATTLCIAVNPLIGLAATVAVLLAMATLTARPYLLRKHNYVFPVRTTLVVTVTLLLGATIAYPTYGHLFGAISEKSGLVISPFRWKSYGVVAANLSLLLVFWVIGYRRWPERDRDYLSAVSLGGIFLVMGSVVLQLPVGNQHNLFNVAIVFLAVPTAAAAMNRGDRGCMVRTVVLAALLVPTIIIVISAYLGRAPVPVRWNGTKLQWLPEDSSRSRLYQWVQENTSAEAVFVVDPKSAPTGLCNVLDFPAFTERVLFSGKRTYLTQTYSDYEYRNTLSAKLTHGISIRSDERAYLSRLSRPLFIVTYQGRDVGLVSRLRAAYGAPAFAESGIALFNYQLP